MIATAAIFISLGIDTFAVALGLGLSGLPRARWVRIGVTFACFEGLMPLVGLLIGQRLGTVFGGYATYIAATILVGIGIVELRESLTDDDNDDNADAPALPSPMRSRPLVLIALSISLDELAVGFALGVLHVPLGPALVYIALQAFALTFVGLFVGQRLNAQLQERAELAAGVVLLVLGIALFLSELTGTHHL